MYFGLRWQFCPYSFKSVGRGHWLLAGWLAAALPRLGQCLQQPRSSRLGLGRLSRLDRHRRSMASWEGKAGGAAWPVTWNLLIFWRFPLNIKLTNEVNKPGNKFYTRDMLLKSRSGQNELKNNMNKKVKETQDLSRSSLHEGATSPLRGSQREGLPYNPFSSPNQPRRRIESLTIVLMKRGRNTNFRRLNHKRMGAQRHL